MELRVSKLGLIKYFTLINDNSEKVVLYMGINIISDSSKY